MKMEKTFVIRNRCSGKKIFAFKCMSFRLCIEIAVSLKIDLSRTNLSRADLSRADLSRADLSGADLSWSDLSGADLSGADLSGADLSWSDLSGADLSRANLSRANLSRADLSGADLSRANLSRADLSRANLSGADLSRANLDYSCLPLWCGSLNANFDDKQIKQFLYHVLSGVKNSNNVSEELKISLLTTDLLTIANEFHRTECERI